MSLSNQRAQVPGYCGYIPGKNSENKFGSTFAQVSKGSYPTQTPAFLTTNIAANSFIQQQHAQSDSFWGDKGKVTAFEAPTKKPPVRNQRQPAESTYRLM